MCECVSDCVSVFVLHYECVCVYRFVNVGV